MWSYGNELDHGETMAAFSTQILNTLHPVLKVGSYDTYLRYWSVLTPQEITFDPEGVRA
jgi:hypothetical protein